MHQLDNKAFDSTLLSSGHCQRGTGVAQWLKCCATNRKVAGSFQDGVTGIFHWQNPSDRTLALWSTQPLTEISTRRFSGGKCGRCVRLTTLPPLCAVVMKSGNLNFLEPSGPLQACNGTDLPLPLPGHCQNNCSRVLVTFLRTILSTALRQNGEYGHTNRHPTLASVLLMACSVRFLYTNSFPAIK